MARLRGTMGRQVRDKLSADVVKRERRKGYYSDGKGLYLRVSSTGAKSWVFRYRVDGALLEMGLGGHDPADEANTVTLVQAREKADVIRKQLRQYRDEETPYHPKELKHAAKQAARTASLLEIAKSMTFRECAERYIETHKAGWRSDRSLGQWQSSLRDHVYPTHEDLPVQAIDVALVMKVLQPIWNEKPETASRVRQRIEAVLDWATASEFRQGENPARWRGHLENLLPKRSRVRRVENFTALAYGEVAGFMSLLRAQSGTAALALEFTILTAARSSEVMGARWSEINLAEGVWTVPAMRTKADREHRVPLSERAIEILHEIEGVRNGDFVFPGSQLGRPLGHSRLLDQLERVRSGLTVHGFRSTFRDWAAERTNYPAELAEMALAHRVGSAVEQAYRRSDLFDRRRRLMDDWARWCDGDGQGAVGEVVTLRA